MYFSQFPIRTFTSSCNLSHVLGYLKQNNKGEIMSFGGIEEVYNSNLLGLNGVEYHLINNIGIDQGVFNFENRNYPPEQGENLFLTIDSNLQTFCEKISSKYKNVEILWASTREAYNYLQARKLKLIFQTKI